MSGFDPRTNVWYYPGYTTIYPSLEAKRAKQPDRNPQNLIHAQIVSEWLKPSDFIKSLSYVSKIAYTVHDKPGQSSIWLINEDGTGKELFREDAFSPAFSPDGRRIAYARALYSSEGEWAGPEPWWGGEIRIADIADYDELVDQTVLEVRGSFEFPVFLRWSPDGQGIFFHRRLTMHSATGPIEFLNLFTFQIEKLDLIESIGPSSRLFDIRRSDGKIVFIKEEEEGATLDVSPKGNPFWNVSKEYYNQAWIMVTDKEGGRQSRIFGPIGIKRRDFSEDEFSEYFYERYYRHGPFFIRWISYPTWSPDGEQIAFWYFDIKRKEDILAIIDTKGKKHKELLRIPEKTGSGLAWSPDGKKIAFEQDGWIWIIDSDGSGDPQRLVEGYDPSWAFVPTLLPNEEY